MLFVFFNDPATTEIYTLSLHDALPISGELGAAEPGVGHGAAGAAGRGTRGVGEPSSTRLRDRKSTRLNSSHQIISYAVFCLKKKKNSINIKVNIRATRRSTIGRRMT